MTITKAVFPVAGLGTRTLPATKITPKEMLHVVDKPVIQYAVEEVIAAGIREIILVTAHGKRSIEQHFAAAPALEAALLEKGRQDAYAQVHDILPLDVSISAVTQTEALGLGHAVLCARDAVGDAPFAVVLPDDLICNEGPGCLAQMVRQYQQTQASVVAVQQVPPQDVSKYGIVQLRPSEGQDDGQEDGQSEGQDDRPNDDKPERMAAIVEKPAPDVAPSRQAVVGRYIFTSGIWRQLQRIGRGSGNEIQLTDAIAALLAHEPVYLCRFSGERYDCGAPLGLLKANVALGLRHVQLGEEFSRYLRAQGWLRHPPNR